MRTVAFSKSGKTTIIEVKNPNSTNNEIIAINKLTNVYIENNVLRIPLESDKGLFVTFAEIENKLSSTDIKDFLVKASVLFYFKQ